MKYQLDWIGRSKWQLDTPVAIVDISILNKNIQDMAEFADLAGVKLRPHIKTHKMLAIAQKQLEAGACGLAVAKLGEAGVMLQTGCRNITIANQIVPGEKIRRLLKLNKEAEVSCAIDSLEGAELLSKAAKRLGQKIPVLIEIDTGLQRCGVLPGEPALKLAEGLISFPGLELKGVMTHAGHAYGAENIEEIARIGKQEGEAMVRTANLLRGKGLTCEVISVGSTPTARYVARVSGVTEIRPGNYVFYDATQVSLGVAKEKQCALSIMATVISRPDYQRAVRFFYTNIA